MILFLSKDNNLSLMAEAIYEKATNQNAQSVGFDEGEYFNQNAIKVLMDNGVIIDKAPKVVDEFEVSKADVILTMTEAQKMTLTYMLPAYQAKIKTIREWAGKRGNVNEPYFDTENTYKTIYKELEKLINAGEKLQRKGFFGSLRNRKKFF